MLAIHPSPIHVMLICLPCLLCATRLASFFFFFAHLPTCSCLSLCAVHTPIQWNYGHLTQTYICPPKTPSFCLITYLFGSSCASHVCLPMFGIFSQFVFSMLLLCLFLCLSAGLFLLSLHVHTWSNGATSKAQAKRARMQAHKGKWLVD